MHDDDDDDETTNRCIVYRESGISVASSRVQPGSRGQFVPVNAPDRSAKTAVRYSNRSYSAFALHVTVFTTKCHLLHYLDARGTRRSIGDLDTTHERRQKK